MPSAGASRFGYVWGYFRSCHALLVVVQFKSW
jgi:hypothetical protein